MGLLTPISYDGYTVKFEAQQAFDKFHIRNGNDGWKYFTFNVEITGDNVESITYSIENGCFVQLDEKNSNDGSCYFKPIIYEPGTTHMVDGVEVAYRVAGNNDLLWYKPHDEMVQEYTVGSNVQNTGNNLYAIRLGVDYSDYLKAIDEANKEADSSVSSKMYIIAEEKLLGQAADRLAQSKVTAKITMRDGSVKEQRIFFYPCESQTQMYCE